MLSDHTPGPFTLTIHFFPTPCSPPIAPDSRVIASPQTASRGAFEDAVRTGVIAHGAMISIPFKETNPVLRALLSAIAQV